MSAMLTAEIASSGYGAVRVLHDVAIEVGAGEIVAVLGGNGAGKTTLLRTLSGVLVRSRARIELDGTDISRVRAHERVAAGLAHVPEGRRVFKGLSVLENLMVVARARRTSDEQIEADLSRMFATFPRLRERSGQRAESLSGGEQQMLAIARGLMSHPRVLMIDEASLGLAPTMIRELFGTLRDLRDEGLSILLVEQNVRESLRLADRAYVLSRGAVAVTGTARDLLEDERVAETYLGLTEKTETRRSLERMP